MAAHAEPVSSLWSRGYAVLPEPERVELREGDVRFGPAWSLNRGAGVAQGDVSARRWNSRSPETAVETGEAHKSARSWASLPPRRTTLEAEYAIPTDPALGHCLWPLFSQTIQ